MIRPITLLCFVAACGSGLYLYQEKHRVQVLDHHIEQTVKRPNRPGRRPVCCTRNGRC